MIRLLFDKGMLNLHDIYKISKTIKTCPWSEDLSMSLRLSENGKLKDLSLH